MDKKRLVLCVAMGILLAAAIAACVGKPGQIGCTNADDYHVGACGILDPCHCLDDGGAALGINANPAACALAREELAQKCPDAGPDASADGPPPDAILEGPIVACPDECLPNAPAGWSDPTLLAVSDAGLPACPVAAPSITYEGYGGLQAEPAVCGPCACAPSQGTCGLPTILTASTGACPGNGPQDWLRPWNPPTGWDGGCTALDPVPGTAACGKSSMTCVRSVTIGPVAVDDSCAPIGPAAPILPPVTWSTIALACTSGMSGPCADPGTVCAPAGAEGFRQCVFHEGEVACPSFSPYSVQLVFHGGVDDTRGCAACTCGPVTGSACSAKVSVYADGVCGAALVSTTGPCRAVPPGVTLGSKSAVLEPYGSGTCEASDAGPTGSAPGSMAATFCCLPM